MRHPLVTIVLRQVTEGFRVPNVLQRRNRHLARRRHKIQWMRIEVHYGVHVMFDRDATAGLPDSPRRAASTGSVHDVSRQNRAHAAPPRVPAHGGLT